MNCAPTGGCSKSEAFPVSPELAALLDSRPDPEANWSFNYGMDFGDFGAPGNLFRSVFSETRTNQLSFGLKGKLEGIDGTWDVIASKGQAKLDIHLEGYASLTRVRTVLGSPNWGQGFFAQGNSQPPGGGFSGGIATCTSGVPVFGANHGDISQDCLNAMYVTLNHQSEMDQKFIEANLQGRAFNMPAGEARFSAGVHSRTNSYYYIFDPLQTENSFNDNPEGFPADNTKGETAVNEVYGEMLLPLLEGKTRRKAPESRARLSLLRLRFAGRRWHLQGVDRLGYHGHAAFPRRSAARDPSPQHRRAVPVEHAIVVGHDRRRALLDHNSGIPFGANPAVNPNAAAVQQLCSQIIGSVAAQYYSPTQQAQINPVVWLPFVDATGNPQVNPEEAKTLTAGIVWSPNTSHERLNGLNLTVDYYDIKISDMISVEGALKVYEKCLSATSNPTFDPQNPACLKIHRNPVTGTATTTTVSYVNSAFAQVSGVDVTADWRTKLAGGTFGVNFLISSLLTEKTQDTVSAPVVEWKGSLGPTANTSLNNGAYNYRTFTTINYGRGDWNLALRWRHLPTAIDAAQAAINANIKAGTVPATRDPRRRWGRRVVRRVRPVRRLQPEREDEPPLWSRQSVRQSGGLYGRSQATAAADPHPARAAARRKPASMTSWVEASTWV